MYFFYELPRISKMFLLKELMLKNNMRLVDAWNYIDHHEIQYSICGEYYKNLDIGE